MADPSTPTPPAMVPVRLTQLPEAVAPLSDDDLLWASQYDAALGRYRSRRLTVALLARYTRPVCTYVAADHASGATEAGFYLDPTGGNFTLTLAPLGAASFAELPLLHVGAGGVATVAPAPGDVLVLPGGAKVDRLALRPGETCRVRAVIVPAPAVSGWYLVGV